MASEFPRRPRLEKGALLVYESNEPNAPLTQKIEFLYNPEQIRRSFAPRAPQQQRQQTGAPQDVLRVAGPPVETITLSIVLDATDQLEQPQANQMVAQNGLHPMLATLELLMVPTTQRMNTIEQQAADGAVQVSEASTPLVLLAWGRSRVVPVLLSSMTVTEELFSPRLDPIRARLELGLRVLTWVEFSSASAGRDAYFGYQKKKEELARLASGGTR